MYLLYLRTTDGVYNGKNKWDSGHNDTHAHTVRRPSSSTFGEFRDSWRTHHSEQDGAWTVLNRKRERNLPTEQALERGRH